MLDKTGFLQRLDEFVRRPENLQRAELYQVDVELMREAPFFALEEVLNYRSSRLVHNGSISFGLSFEEVISALGLHQNPTQIPFTQWEGAPKGIMHRRFNLGLGGGVVNYIADNRRATSRNVYLDFFEDLFGLPRETLKCTIWEPSIGTQLNGTGELAPVLLRAIREKVPVFVNGLDINGANRYDKGYAINGFSI